MKRSRSLPTNNLHVKHVSNDNDDYCDSKICHVEDDVDLNRRSIKYLCLELERNRITICKMTDYIRSLEKHIGRMDIQISKWQIHATTMEKRVSDLQTSINKLLERK